MMLKTMLPLKRLLNSFKSIDLWAAFTHAALVYFWDDLSAFISAHSKDYPFLMFALFFLLKLLRKERT